MVRSIDRLTGGCVGRKSPTGGNLGDEKELT